MPPVEQEPEVRVLFIGDVVGPEATGWLAERLRALRGRHRADAVVANAENCAVTGPTPFVGFGMTAELVDRLLDAGVDVVTSGNHAWDGPEADACLDRERVLRPHNVPAGRAGRGVVTISTAVGPLSVVNLAGSVAIADASPPVPAFEDLQLQGTVLVDYHGGRPFEKHAFAYAIDGRAAAVLGTHAHEPALRLHRLPGGTAVVDDVGYTGPQGGIGGIGPEHFVARLRGSEDGVLPPFALAEGPMTLGAVLVDIEGGATRSLMRVEAWEVAQ